MPGKAVSIQLLVGETRAESGTLKISLWNHTMNHPWQMWSCVTLGLGIPTALAPAAAVILGRGTAGVCLASSPPLPPPTAQPYDPHQQSFDMCHPPYRGG